ncbi:YciI family protein [Bradyrhizobium sp.]|uniref:YciI family protein n=1 Tax=Bradyrhizobium sp. TaxID=376 RepID=UPI0023837347|nr:YciI family protein [Bradyrhizobium sp.]MDE2377228.1 YciI family protein [Bradyrhizobium sp.]
MLYAILAYHVEGEVLSMTPEEDEALMAALRGVHSPLRQKGHFGPCARLDETATARTLRGPGAGTVLDGPFAETKEQLLGFYIMDFAHEDEAVEAARALRKVNRSAVYEIRPIKLFLPSDGFGATSDGG